MTEHFINDGYGWTCKRCRATDEAETRAPEGSARSRFFHEGEAEEREPRLSSRALARWRAGVAPRRILFCTLCGIEEELREES